VERKINVTDPKVRKQCTLLASVGWKQGERGKVTGKGMSQFAAGESSWKTGINFECY
jgi:hypothetical protein